MSNDKLLLSTLSKRTALAAILASGICHGRQAVAQIQNAVPGQGASTAQQYFQNTQPMAQDNLPFDAGERTQLTAGDLVTLSVFEAPELTGPLRVTSRGTFDLPLIGSVPVAGLTTLEAAALIREKLISGSFLKDPQVVITLAELAHRSVVVLGEVMRPGATPLSGPRRLWEVVGAAGGATQFAGTTVVIRHRDQDKSPDTYTENWDKAFTNQPNPEIAAGDTVQVLRAGVVYVIGQVARQGGYPFTRAHLTVAQAIALAQGVNYSAKSKHARLIRRNDQGQTVTEINVAAIIKGDAPDVSLEDNDILYIPNSVAKLVLSRGIEAAVGLSTQVAIYRTQ